MKLEVEKVSREVLKRIIPGDREREETLSFVQRLLGELSKKLRSSGVVAEVNIQGSVAKDTWIAGEKDLDVFIELPRASGREAFKEVLELVKSFVGRGWREAYAEHPYLEAEVEGYKIDFVPCFTIEEGEKISSAVDRTPLHTEYVKGHLNQHLKDDVRLFKQFAHGIGAYGAEIKVQGLSGYLCELIVLHYGSFFAALKGISSWRRGQVIDIEKLYKEKVEEVKLRFGRPLIVIDPVDKLRNVAAVVSEERFGELIMASKLFLDKPEVSFFFPEETRPHRNDVLSKQLMKLGLDFIFLIIRGGGEVPDVLWGELYKTSRALKTILTNSDFTVIRDGAWSDGQLIVLTFSLESTMIPSSKKHIGPPVDSEDAMSFITKYAGSDVVGPWIDNSRWVVCVKRNCVNAVSLLKSVLKEGGKDIGVSSGLTEQLKEAEVYLNEEVLSFYSINLDFAKFLTDFIRGKPKWVN